ncbi:RNA 2',3'-cyclic phosphodiesterase [Domibacillus epiphyticus]|uniref:RNA 2',3'-cyclic phosphodiesterase n=1 Tax=Domibacillus epiphyticus TaxID=1714355 RepID=A0A1V2A918_9BACI|nr:RNA 2',3'-cyclic phosphodiesterase [Domibacillus epiphyticus]OMP67420.1 2'-5' RNA ligase [Domibacillus epiphyticus]
MKSKPHYFFAVVIPDDVKKTIYHEMKRRQFPFKRFTHPDDYHITLSFIGAAEENALLEACTLIKQKLLNERPFQVTLSSFHTFGTPLSPRIFWVGMDESEALYRLQSHVADACRKAGFILDKKPFRPHVTTARKWIGEGPYKPGSEPEWPSFQINEVALYETNSMNEPRYTKKWSHFLNLRKEE